VELASPSEVLDHTRSALVVPSAPPSPFETASGFSSCNLTPGTKAPEDPLLEFASPSEPNCVSAARAPVSSRPLARPRRPVEPGNRLSWGSFSPRALRRRMPLSHPPRACARSRECEGYQALTGAVLRVLAPLDGSGCARGTHAPLAGLAVRRGTPTLRGLVPCRSRPLESPFRAFPSRGAVPALAGPFSLVSSRRLPNGAVRSEGFAAPFAVRADLSPQLARRLAGLKKPGRRFPGVARAPHVSRCRGRLRRLVSERPGSPDSAARTLTSELYSPRESVLGI